MIFSLTVYHHKIRKKNFVTMILVILIFKTVYGNKVKKKQVHKNCVTEKDFSLTYKFFLHCIWFKMAFFLGAQNLL